MVEEETSMKKRRNVLILVITLAVLSGLYVFLQNRPASNDGTTKEDVVISKFDKNDIIKMELKSKNGTLTFHKVEKEVVKENKDGEKETVIESVWEVDYPHPVTLKKTAVDDIAYSFASLYAERVIEEETPEDLGPYGLDEPQVVAEATLKDGSKKVFYLGNRTPAGNSYYLMAEGDPRIFEVWMNHGEHFSSTLADVRDKNLTAINTQELTYLKMQKKDSKPIEVKINDSQSEDEARFGLGLWRLTQPYNEPMGVHSENFQKVLDKLSGLVIEEFIDDDPQNLAKYGLEEPNAELLVKDNENTLHLYFGDEYEDGKKVYFKTADSKAVYGMRKDKITFMDTKAFDIVDKFTYIVNIDNVDKIIVEGGGKTHTLTLERTVKKAEKEGEEDEEITTYFVDGKEVEEKPFKKYYQSLIGILADAENNKELEGNPEVKTTFFLNVGKEREVHINYVPYDNDFYAVFRGGKAEFLVYKGQVKNMLDTLEALINGELEA